MPPYSKKFFVTDGKPPINGPNLDSMDQGILDANTAIDTHAARTDNPHAVTAAQVGALTQAQGDTRYVNETDHTKAAHDALLIDAATLDGLDSTALQTRSEKAQANGYASLDGAGKVPIGQIPDTVVGAMDFQTTWDASTNTPALSGTGAGHSKGDYWRVSVAGATSLGGITDWKVGDYAVWDGSAWSKIDNTEDVSSVFGRKGAVVAQNGDYNASQITNAPAGGIAASTVQAAINELDSEKLAATLSALQALFSGGPADTTKYLRSDGAMAVPPTGSNYSTIQDEGTALTQRTKMNFRGAGVVASDDSTNGVTNVDISGASVGAATQTALGTVKVSAAPADAANPIAVETTDGRVPTQGENDALQGTGGTPSGTNRYVTAQTHESHTHSYRFMFSTFFLAGDVNAKVGDGLDPIFQTSTADEIRVSCKTAPAGGTLTLTFVRVRAGTDTTIGSVTLAAGTAKGTTSGLAVALAADDDVRVDVTTGTGYTAGSAKNVTAKLRYTY